MFRIGKDSNVVRKNGETGFFSGIWASLLQFGRYDHENFFPFDWEQKTISETKIMIFWAFLEKILGKPSRTFCTFCIKWRNGVFFSDAKFAKNSKIMKKLIFWKKDFPKFLCRKMVDMKCLDCFKVISRPEKLYLRIFALHVVRSLGFQRWKIGK